MADPQLREPTPILTACIIAEAASIDEARSKSSAFMESECGPGTNPAAGCLPTALSLTGAPPATHWLCCMPIVRAQFDRMRQWIVDHRVPVTAQLVESEAEFLAANGLKRIG